MATKAPSTKGLAASLKSVPKPVLIGVPVVAGVAFYVLQKRKAAKAATTAATAAATGNGTTATTTADNTGGYSTGGGYNGGGGYADTNGLAQQIANLQSQFANALGTAGTNTTTSAGTNVSPNPISTTPSAATNASTVPNYTNTPTPTAPVQPNPLIPGSTIAPNVGNAIQGVTPAGTVYSGGIPLSSGAIAGGTDSSGNKVFVPAPGAPSISLTDQSGTTGITTVTPSPQTSSMYNPNPNYFAGSGYYSSSAPVTPATSSTAGSTATTGGGRGAVAM